MRSNLQFRFEIMNLFSYRKLKNIKYQHIKQTTKFLSFAKNCHNLSSMCSERNIKKSRSLTGNNIFQKIQFGKQYSIKNFEDTRKQSCNEFIKFEYETSVLELGFNICPSPRTFHKNKLAQGVFQFVRQLKLKEYLFWNSTITSEDNKHNKQI